jgi:protease-4
MDRRSPPSPSASNSPAAASPQTIHVHNHPPRGGWWLRVALALLIISVVLNFTQLAAYRDYFAGSTPPYERYVEGSRLSSDKVALLEIEGVIMPPYSDRILETIEAIGKDDNVRGVVVAVDSPGGLVADSHRIYRALQKLQEKKPIVTSMGRMAASGGYYIAMAGGPESKVYAEEITWTGSIGVIIPRYDLSTLGQKIGIESDALKTGPLKNSLDPFQPLTEEERKVWDAILEESLDEFVRVIDESRPALQEEDVRRVATGQIFTAEQALQLKLIDEIGDRDAALEALKAKLKLEDPRIVRYEHPPTVLETLLGAEAAAMKAPPVDPLKTLLDASVPRAMYLFGWHLGAQP